jgi:hypothetical protein
MDKRAEKSSWLITLRAKVEPKFAPHDGAPQPVWLALNHLRESAWAQPFAPCGKPLQVNDLA